MKRILLTIITTLAIASGFAMPLAGCTTTPAQQAAGTVVTAQDFNKAYLQATTVLDAATTLAKAAVNTDVLKGADADNTIAVIEKARDAIKLARTFSDPSLGITKLSIATAALTATQTYLIKLTTNPTK